MEQQELMSAVMDDQDTTKCVATATTLHDVGKELLSALLLFKVLHGESLNTK